MAALLVPLLLGVAAAALLASPGTVNFPQAGSPGPRLGSPQQKVDVSTPAPAKHTSHRKGTRHASARPSSQATAVNVSQHFVRTATPKPAARSGHRSPGGGSHHSPPSGGGGSSSGGGGSTPTPPPTSPTTTTTAAPPPPPPPPATTTTVTTTSEPPAPPAAAPAEQTCWGATSFPPGRALGRRNHTPPGRAVGHGYHSAPGQACTSHSDESRPPGENDGAQGWGEGDGHCHGRHYDHDQGRHGQGDESHEGGWNGEWGHTPPGHAYGARGHGSYGRGHDH